MLSQKLNAVSSPLGICVSLVACLILSNLADAQISNSTQTDQIEAHLNAGEFPLALQLAEGLSAGQRDHWLSQIAQTQMSSDAPVAAYETAGMIGYDSNRAAELTGLADIRRGAAGAAGGITEADFQSLIDLIQGTVSPDTWQDTGQD